MIKYRFVLKNEVGGLLSLSDTYTEESGTPDLNKNLAGWVSYGFPGCADEDNGAGIICPGDRIDIEWL